MRELASSKKILVGIAAGAVVIVCAFLVYGIMVAPARQPYRDALTQYKNVDTALGRTNISLNSSTASDEEFNKSVAAVKTAFVSLGKENAALAKESVLTSGEGKTLYDAYNEKLQGYITYNSNVLIAMQKVRPVLRACSEAMGTVTENAAGEAVIRKCATDMQAATDVPDADYKQLATAFHEDYTRFADVLGAMATLSDPKGANAAQYAALTSQRTEIVNDFSTASTTFSKNVQAHRQAILATDTAKALHDYLEDKSRIL